MTGDARLTVLVADDNETARAQVVAILGELGHEAVAVGDGDEAVAALGALDVDLAVIDLEMPGRRGDAVAAELGARAPVIGLSSAGADRSEWGDTPLLAWLPKPVNARALAEALRRAAGAGAPPRPDDDPPVDLDHLATYTGGDRALEAELAGLFEASCDRYLDAMRTAADDRTWREAAHGLKGAARGIGANETGRLAAFAETLAGDAGAAKRAEALHQLEDAARRVHGYFREHLASG